jgi:integrase
VFVGLDADGKPIQRSHTVHASGVKAAREELAAMVTAANKGGSATGAETVGELLDRYIAHAESVGRSPTTLRQYRRIADKIIRPEFGSVRLAKLTALDLDGLYGRLTRKGNKPATVRRTHALIAASLARGVKWGLVAENVALKADPPSTEQVDVKAPTPDQVRAIVTVAEANEPLLGVFFMLAALTGARRGELCALRWSDWSGRTLTISRSVYETAGGGMGEKSTKTHQARRVSLDAFGLELLRRHRESVEALALDLGVTVADDAFMFSRSPAGVEPVRPDVVTKAFNRACKVAGVAGVHLHSLRHFSATTAIAAGADVVTVAGRLGHRDSSMTLRVYSHALAARDEAAGEAIGAALSGVPALPAAGSPDGTRDEVAHE